MQMKIALFEDNIGYADSLCGDISCWSKEADCTVSIERFFTPTGFNMESISTFDCVLLDVKMPGMDGITFAREIRNVNQVIAIVFISDFIEFGIEGYEVNAVRFLNKNDMQFSTKLKECMDCILNLIRSNDNSYYTFKSDGNTISIYYKDIVYIEIFDHSLLIWTTNDNYKERKTISSIKNNLPPQFAQCSRSLIVNVNYVSEINMRVLKLYDGKTLVLSKPFADPVMQVFLRYH